MKRIKRILGSIAALTVGGSATIPVIACSADEIGKFSDAVIKYLDELNKKGKDDIKATATGIQNLPASAAGTHWEFQVDDGEFSRAVPTDLKPGQKVVINAVADNDTEIKADFADLVTTDEVEISVSDTFLEQFSNFYVNLNETNLYKNLPSRPDPDHTDWLYDSGVSYYGEADYHYGEVDATMLSPGRPLKMKLVAAEGYYLSKPVERTDIQVTKHLNTAAITNELANTSVNETTGINHLPTSFEGTHWEYKVDDGAYSSTAPTTFIPGQKISFKLVASSNYFLDTNVERTDVVVTGMVNVPSSLDSNLDKTTVNAGTGIINLPAAPENSHWEYRVGNGVYSPTVPTTFMVGQKISFKLVANQNYLLSTLVERKGVVTQGRDNIEITISDEFLTAFNSFSVKPRAENPYESLPAAPDHTDWVYDSGESDGSGVGYHYGEVDPAKLSPDHPLKMMLVPQEGYRLSQPVERTDIVIENDNIRPADSKYFTNRDLVTKLGKGEAVTQAEMAQFFDQIAFGDAITGFGQDGVNLPTSAWEDLNAPQLDYVPNHIYAPYVKVGEYGKTMKTFGDIEGLKYATVGFLQQDERVEPLSGKIVGQAKVSEKTADSDNKFRWMVENINKLRAKGGDAIISFGGEAGVPIWKKINDPVLLAAYLIKLAEAGKFHQFDYDFEDVQKSDATALQRLATASLLAQDYLKNKGFTLDISITLPIMITAFPDESVLPLEIFLNSGLALKTINILNFNYGKIKTPGHYTEVTVAAKAAINNAANAIVKIVGNEEILDLTQAYHLLGSTHMVPWDDSVPPMPISGDAAKGIYDYAVEKGLSMLSIWSLERDANREAGLDENRIDSFDFTKTGGYFEPYNAGQTEPTTRFQRPGVDIYASGAYKTKGSATIANGILDPDVISEYQSGKFYYRGDVVKTADGYFMTTQAIYGSPSSESVGLVSNQAGWVSLGSQDWYEKYYETFLNPTEDIVAHTADNYYYFLQRKGKSFRKPISSSAAAAERIINFWKENAWEWKDGTVARKGMVFQYNGQLWYFQAQAETGSAPSEGDSWTVWDPTDKSQVVTNYWDYISK